MKLVNFMTVGLVIVSSVGCVASLPKVAPNGKYGVVSFSGKPIIEFEYPTAEACALDMDAAQNKDMSARKSVSEGRVVFSCNSFSLEGRLSYQSTSRSIVTGQVYPTRTHTKEACVYFSKINTDPTTKYGCAEE